MPAGVVEFGNRMRLALERSGWNQTKAATLLGLNRDQVRYRIIDSSSLPVDVKERLIALAGRHVTTDGVLLIVSRALRSQAQNREAAQARLVALLKRAAKPPKKRKATRPGRAVRQERLISKQRQSAVKRSRSRRDDE